MQRFYLPSSRGDERALLLDGKEGHHAAQVLRVRAGERVEVLNGRGTVIECVAREARKREVELEVLRATTLPASPVRVTLYQAIAKPKSMDWVVQKGTELGVSRIQPVRTARVVSQFDGERADGKLEKWRAVAVEAAKQCGTPWLPEIQAPLDFDEALRSAGGEFWLVASLDEKRRQVREAFREFAPGEENGPGAVGVWVGPEGDFTPEELRALRKSGARAVTIGLWVLRCETAAVAALALVQQEISTRER